MKEGFDDLENNFASKFQIKNVRNLKYIFRDEAYEI